MGADEGTVDLLLQSRLKHRIITAKSWFTKLTCFSNSGMYSGRAFQTYAYNGTRDLLWLNRLEQ